MWVYGWSHLICSQWEFIRKTEPSGVKLEEQCSGIHGIQGDMGCYNQIRLMPKQMNKICAVLNHGLEQNLQTTVSRFKATITQPEESHSVNNSPGKMQWILKQLYSMRYRKILICEMIKGGINELTHRQKIKYFYLPEN